MLINVFEIDFLFISKTHCCQQHYVSLPQNKIKIKKNIYIYIYIK